MSVLRGLKHREPFSKYMKLPLFYFTSILNVSLFLDVFEVLPIISLLDLLCLSGYKHWSRPQLVSPAMYEQQFGSIPDSGSIFLPTDIYSRGSVPKITEESGTVEL